jgi:hypothetical protein
MRLNRHRALDFLIGHELFRRPLSRFPDHALSYNVAQKREMAHPTRFERVTSTFGGWRSIQLSYEDVNLFDFRDFGLCKSLI